MIPAIHTLCIPILDLPAAGYGFFCGIRNEAASNGVSDRTESLTTERDDKPRG